MVKMPVIGERVVRAEEAPKGAVVTRSEIADRTIHQMRFVVRVERSKYAAGIDVCA